jgi:hypothetical protein
MLLLAFAAIARGEAAFDAIEGTYYYDPLNRITLQGDQVTWQYVTDLYVPSVAYDQSERTLIPDKTLCKAYGHFTVQGDQVFLEIDRDLAQLMIGERILTWDAETGTLAYGEDVFIKQQPGSDGGEVPASPAVRGALSRDRPYLEAAFRVMAGMLSLDQADSPVTFEATAAVLSSSQVDLEAGQAAWAWHVAKAMEELNNNWFGIWYCGGSSLELSPTYWRWDSNVGDGLLFDPRLPWSGISGIAWKALGARNASWPHERVSTRGCSTCWARMASMRGLHHGAHTFRCRI